MTTLWNLNRKPRLLFVEDDFDLGNMFRIYFANLAEVTLAVEQAQVLALYSSQPFDLVILDLGIQGLDAYRFMRSIRASANKIPIVFLTPLNKSSDNLQEFKIDTDDEILKPFDIEELRLRIKGA